MASESDRMRAQRMAEDQADFAGSWIDYLADDPSPEDPGPYVFNVAFTGDPVSPEDDLRSLSGPGVEDFGSQVLWSATNVMRNQVEIGVVTSDDEALAVLDAAFGSGAVSVIPALRPIP